MVTTPRLLIALLLLLCTGLLAPAKNIFEELDQALNELDAALGGGTEKAKLPDGVLFLDDFQRDKLGEWTVTDDPAASEASAWSVSKGALLQRSNAYRKDREYEFWQGTHITAGSAKWKDYRFTAKVASTDDDGFGLLIRYVDKNNFYRFITVQDGANGGPFRRIEKFANGKRYVLAEEKKGFTVGKTYAVAFTAAGNRLTVQLDNEPALTATDNAFPAGKIGFLTYANPGFSAAAVRVENAGAPAQTITLTGPSASALLAKTYPATNLRIQLGIKYSKPGVIFDTVGINAAPAGSFALSVDANGKVTFQVYDPRQQSPARIANGWHILTSTATLKPNTEGEVTVEVAEKEVILSLNGAVDKRVPLAAKLSGQPLYVGDFPGDDSWGPKYNIHPAMTGAITVKYLGALTAAPAGNAPPVQTPPPAGGKIPQPADQGIPVPVPTDTPQAVDAGVKKIEDAFRSGNLEAVLKLTAPSRHETYRPMFEAHRAELPRVAGLLATRKLVSTSGAFAEFTVTDGGRAFPITFERIDGVWCLLDL